MGRKSKRRRKQEAMPFAGAEPSPGDAGAFDLEIVDDLADAGRVRPAGAGSSFLSNSNQMLQPEATTVNAADTEEPQGVLVRSDAAGVGTSGRVEAAPAREVPAGLSRAAPVDAPTTAVAPAPVAAGTPPAVETLGEILLAAREERGLSLEETSARTRISARMLRHLENDRFAELPAEAYVRGFLRNYGTFLGLDVGMLLWRYEALLGQRAVEPAPEVWDEVVMPPAPKRVWKPSPRLLVVVGIVALSAAGFAVWKTTGGPTSWGLRPRAGLEQIESELRAAQRAESADTAPEVGGLSEQATSDSGAASVAPPAIEPEPPVATPAPQPPKPAAVAAVSVRGSPTATGSRREDTSPRLRPPVTDMVEESRPPAPVVTVPRPVEVRMAEPVDGRSLVLTATALDSCALRLQIDDDARQAQRYQFTRRGESRTWTARQSFRIVARRAANLEMRLNGKLVTLPQEGRTLVIDRATPGHGAARRESSGPPPRKAGTGRRRSTHQPARTTAPRTPSPEHAAGPPR